MLIFFIYLAIGGILLSGILIGENEEIFCKDLRKSLKGSFEEYYDPHAIFIIFSMIMAAMMILFWLPFLIFAIAWKIYDRNN